jgi:hypothetical protein
MFALFSGCGGADHNEVSTSDAQSSHGLVEACLRKGHAQVAQAASDLFFLQKAEANKEVSRPGFAYDKSSNAIVRVWTAPSVENHPPSWLVWVSQPLGRSRSPQEVAGSNTAQSYVMYAVQPKAAQRRVLEHCISFAHSAEKGAPSFTLHKDELTVVK